MQTYRLTFDKEPKAADTLEFEAPSLSAALRMADGKIGDRPAEIWQGDNRLARIRKGRSNSEVFWEVS